MNKLLITALLAGLLQSCFTHRANENETFLLLNRPEDRLMILSILPADTSGIAISSLFVNRFEDQSGQSNAWLHTFDPMSGQCTDGTWFIDSLMTFRDPGFPVLLAPAERDSVTAFRFVLDRRKATFETGPPVQSETQYTVRYEAQRPFETSKAGTAFGISGVNALAATLGNVRGRKQEQSSIVSVHCFDQTEQLFRRDRSWYWLDYVIDGKAGHLFFEADAAGTTHIHYNVSPNGGALTIALQPGSDPAMVLRQDASEPLQVRVVSPTADRSSKTSFRAETVALLRGSVKAGSGILYKL